MACNGRDEYIYLNRDLYYKWQDRPDGSSRMVVCEEDDPECFGGFHAFRKSGEHAHHRAYDDDEVDARWMKEVGDYIANKRCHYEGPK